MKIICSVNTMPKVGEANFLSNSKLCRKPDSWFCAHGGLHGQTFQSRRIGGTSQRSQKCCISPSSLPLERRTLSHPRRIRTQDRLEIISLMAICLLLTSGSTSTKSGWLIYAKLLIFVLRPRPISLKLFFRSYKLRWFPGNKCSISPERRKACCFFVRWSGRSVLRPCKMSRVWKLREKWPGMRRYQCRRFSTWRARRIGRHTLVLESVRFVWPISFSLSNASSWSAHGIYWQGSGNQYNLLISTFPNQN